jgi:hypothetical protein
MQNIINAILSNPAILGVIITTVLGYISIMLTKLDQSGLEQKYSSQIHIVFLVVSFVATALNLASTGQLGSLDMTSVAAFLNYWVPLVVAGKAFNQVITTKK